jgi:hypothetical protein
MDDIRILWLRDRIYEFLNINTDENEVFEEFMLADDGENEMKIAKFLNQTQEDEDYALLFNKEQKEEDIEVEIELSKFEVSY